jgi:hypothetical protein
MELPQHIYYQKKAEKVEVLSVAPLTKRRVLRCGLGGFDANFFKKKTFY